MPISTSNRTLIASKNTRSLPDLHKKKIEQQEQTAAFLRRTKIKNDAVGGTINDTRKFHFRQPPQANSNNSKLFKSAAISVAAAKRIVIPL